MARRLEYAPDDLCDVPGLKMPDGSPARLYSAFRKGPVLLHSKWMRQYGIDGVFLSRFIGETASPTRSRHVNTVLASLREGCHREGRVWAMMLDLSMGRRRDDQDGDGRLEVPLRSRSRSARTPRYLHHQGKPVVLSGASGLRTAPGRPSRARSWSSSSRHDPQYGGRLSDRRRRSVLADPARRVPHGRRLGEVYRSFDAISPWDAGRYRDDASMDRIRKQVWEGDLAELKATGKGYMPTAFPGFSWDNLRRCQPGRTMIPRRKGEFYWRQFAIFRELGIRTVFVGMFDEVDEGTAIYKVADKVPVGKYFVTYEGLPQTGI